VPKPVLGLIGGIGSGKSTVAAEFAKCGAAVIAGDQLGHEALREPSIKEKVLARWGKGIETDGEIDRRKLGRIVFADPAERRELEALVHPEIKRRIEEEIQKAQANPRVTVIVLDAAIMLEAGWTGPCDALVFVDAPREIRLARLAQRGLSAKDLEAREQAQMPLEEKKRRADYVIENVGSVGEVALQVQKLLEGISGLQTKAKGTRRRKLIIVLASVVAVIVVGGALWRIWLHDVWFRSDKGDEWTFSAREHGFSVRLPSSDWKTIKEPAGAAAAFHNAKHFGMCIVHATKETKDIFDEVSVPWLKGLLTKDESELLSAPYYKEGHTVAGNKYAFLKVKAKADRGGAVFVAASVVWCPENEVTVKVTMEGQLRMTSHAGSAAEWEYFEKAADLVCLSPK
jgi:dephospho-CoA kinase